MLAVDANEIPIELEESEYNERAVHVVHEPYLETRTPQHPMSGNLRSASSIRREAQKPPPERPAF